MRSCHLCGFEPLHHSGLEDLDVSVLMVPAGPTMILKLLGDPMKSVLPQQFPYWGNLQSTLWKQFPGPRCCMQFRKETRELEGGFVKLSSWSRDTDYSPVRGRWLCALKHSETADLCGLFMTLLTARTGLEKNHTMLKILCRLAWLQAVRMYILIFILPADIWIFYKYNVDSVFVFLYKSGLLSTQAWRGLPQERSFVSCGSPWFWMRHSPPLLSGGADLGVGSCHSLGSVWHSHSCV